MRRGISMVEVVVLVGLAACLMLPVLELSGRNVSDPQDQLERQVATSMCLDLCERLKTFSMSRTLPGEPAIPGEGFPALKEKYLYNPLRPELASNSLFQVAYQQQLTSMGITFAPTVERTPDRSAPGVFRLDVSVKWVNAQGHARSVRAARYCYAP